MRNLKSIVFVAACLSIGGCAVFGGTPQEQLDTARFGFTTAVALYNTICLGPAAPAACTDPKAIAAETAAKDLATKAFAAAQASIDAGKPDRDALVQASLDAVLIIENLVASLREQPSGRTTQ